MNRRHFLTLLTTVGCSLAMPKWVRNSARKKIGILSGFKSIDNLVGGFHPKELTIIAARPYMGMSAALYQFTSHAALREKRRVALYSLKDAQTEVMSRMLKAEAGLSQYEGRIWNLTEKNAQKLMSVAEKFSKSKLYLDDHGVTPISEIFRSALKLKEQIGLDFILIDSMQLIKSDRTIVPQLKDLAVKLSVPVIVTSEVFSVVDVRKNKRPLPKDLIGPSPEELDQYADIVMTLYREDYYKQSYLKTRQVAEFTVHKNTNGKLGTAKLIWNNEMRCFKS